MKLYKVDNDNIYFSGDLHGEFKTINVTINKYNLEDCSIIVCGDIGIGFEKEEYYNQTFNRITKTLKKRNIHLFLFRGNHDNKDYFDGEHFNNFEFIHVIPDYSIISSPTRNILCVGGATSIDRTWRLRDMAYLMVDYMRHHSCGYDEAEEKAKKLYWENEPIVYCEDELKQINDSGIKIDTVCTHTAPSFCQPITKIGVYEWLSVDPSLEDELNNERKCCDNILDYLKDNNHPIKNWYYGHFHFHNVEIIDDVKYTLCNMTKELMELNY